MLNLGGQGLNLFCGAQPSTFFKWDYMLAKKSYNGNRASGRLAAAL